MAGSKSGGSAQAGAQQSSQLAPHGSFRQDDVEPAASGLRACKLSAAVGGTQHSSPRIAVHDVLPHGGLEAALYRQ